MKKKNKSINKTVEFYFLPLQYDLNIEIKREVHRLLDVITKKKLEFSKKLNEREFTHLYDFQKYFLHRSMRRFMAVVRTKSYHYWNQKEKIMTWKNLGKTFKNYYFMLPA